jgi:hypothetical protein
MSDRNATRRILGILGASASVALMASCGPRANDINTVQPGYVKKAIFQTGDEWYYRRSIVDSETTNSFAIEGSGDIFLDRVKFRIEEDWLIAYKPYEAIPGSQDGEYEGKLNFEGPVLGAWPITSHFDIIRGYDPSTGNKTNIISENSSDRPWYDREFMRIDWASNAVERSVAAGWGIYELVYYPFDDYGSVLDGATDTRWSNLDSSPTDPYASRFTDDYVEIVNHVVLGMDIINCATMVGFSYDAYGHCGYGEAKIRSSFVRIDKPSDFIPRDFPDSVVVKDSNGQVIEDEETGELKRESIFERFGYYRLETPTYDRGYGTTESGRLFRAFLFNLWERHTDDAGNVLPYNQRTPKPVVYYLNAEYPARWRQIAAEVADDYNRVLQGMVADLMGRPKDQVPRMFEIRDNDCNIDNVKKFVSTNADLEFAVARAVCSDSDSCANPMEKIGIGNLEKVCTSLEAATRDPETGKPAFDWQRIGDARYKMLVWLANPQMSGWGGYGPMHADARTGETVSATSYLRGFSYEVGASRVVDYIELMNGTKSVEDTIYGQDIRRQIQQLLSGSNKFSGVGKAGSGLRARIRQRTEELGRNKAERLPEIDPNHQLNRMKRADGTRVATEGVISNEDIALAALGKWHPGEAVSEDLLRKASPNGMILEQSPFAPARDRTRNALSKAGFCFLDADVDPHFAGLALDLKDQSREEMYKRVAHRLIKHVMLHELGHNFGLEHNFEGSYDALNYYDEFWRLHFQGDEEKVAGNYDEMRNTTVMEYMSTKGLFTDRLGKYDEAAIRFGYGNQVQVFKTKNESALAGGDLRKWRLLHDYNEIPGYLCTGDHNGDCSDANQALSAIVDREWVTFDPQNPPQNEVPYLFCNEVYSRRTPWCATFDYGSSLSEIMENYYVMWSGYFFFNNFIRDRLTPVAWNPWNATLTSVLAMRNVNVVNQYLQFFQAINPRFVEGDVDGDGQQDQEAGPDMAATVARGLNMSAEILSTPEPIRMCPWPQSNPPVYIPYYYFNSGFCDEYAPLDSQYAIDAEAIQPPLGPARPASLGFTDDFVEYDISFIGSYFDKNNVLWTLGLNNPTLFRFNYDLDVRSYQTSLYRLFEPEIRSLIDRMVTFDPYLISQTTAQQLGSYWCRNPEFPDTASMGKFVARDMVDPDSGRSWPDEPANCESMALIYPTLLRNMPFLAMYYAHALYSSDFDAQLDVGKSMKVFALGSDDEPTSWRTLPANQICECKDQLTGLTYRSVHQPPGIADIGCRLIERTCEAQTDYENDPTNDYYRERYRAWMERLEYARDLTKIFNP